MNETINERQAALEALKPGDIAYVRGSNVYASLTKITVTKITATQIVGSDGEKYSRENGRGVKKQDRWGSRDTLLPATAEYTAMYEKQENLALIEKQNWKALSDETLAAVAAILLKKEQ